MSPSLLAARRSLLALAVMAVASSTQAQNKLDTVVTSATRTPQKLSEVLADLTVITRADIERQAFGSVGDLLRSQACFELVRNGGPFANTSMFVRGADSRHTAVLIDGIRYDSQASSGATWQNIPLAQIERIEIVRGAASAVYGSDAIGGVVQIFTRKGDGKPTLEITAGAGNRGLQKGGISLTGMTGIVDYAFSLSGEHSDGYNIRPTTDAAYTPDRDGYRQGDGSARVGVQLAKEHRVEVMAMRSQSNAQYDASAKPTVDDHSLNQMKALRGSWAAQWSPVLNTELSAGESIDRYEIPPPGSPYLTETRTRSYALNGGHKVGDHQFTGVIERREDRLTNTGLTQSVIAGRGDRANDGFGAGWLWSGGPLSLQLNARHDDDSEFGGASTGMLAAGWKLGGGWRVRGSWGTAFRAPSLYQRFSDYGNKSLVPERGRNAEVGLHFEQGNSNLGVTVYRNLVDNLIVFGPPDAAKCPSFGCYDNIGQGRLQGLSLSASTQLGIVRLSGSLDLQAPKDVTDGSANYGKLLARRSRQHASLRADTNFGSWDLGALVQVSGKRFDNAGNTTKLGGYATLDLDAQYEISKPLRLQFKLENAFNRHYQSANGYAAQPVQAYVGLRYTPQF
jgi:vitamin B12 transporter